MENAIVIGILAAMALACEWWLRRREAKRRPHANEGLADPLEAGPQSPVPHARRLSAGEVPFDPLRDRLPAAHRPPTFSAN